MIYLRRCLATFFAALLILAVRGAWAEGQFVDIAPKNETEIQLVLDTLEASINDNLVDVPPIVMMLHGDEAHRFVRNNYTDNKALVDQTAKLAAYDVIDVQVCAIWLQKNNYSSADLFPFVSPVPYGAGELERLEEDEGYNEYSVSL